MRSNYVIDLVLPVIVIVITRHAGGGGGAFCVMFALSERIGCAWPGRKKAQIFIKLSWRLLRQPTIYKVPPLTVLLIGAVRVKNSERTKWRFLKTTWGDKLIKEDIWQKAKDLHKGFQVMYYIWITNIWDRIVCIMKWLFVVSVATNLKR